MTASRAATSSAVRRAQALCSASWDCKSRMIASRAATLERAGPTSRPATSPPRVVVISHPERLNPSSVANPHLTRGPAASSPNVRFCTALQAFHGSGNSGLGHP